MPSLRTIPGFLIAPISPGLLIGLVASAFAYGTPGEQIWLIAMSAKLGYPIAVALGVPLWLLLRWRGWNGLLAYVMAGALLGLIAYVIHFALELR